MVYRYGDDEFKRKWMEMEDPESASAMGVRFFKDLLDGRIDPIKRLEVLKAAVDPAWDGPRADVQLVLEALMKAEIAVYNMERSLPLGAPRQIQVQGTIQTYIAKGWHRKRNYKQAVLVSLNMIKRLEDIVGGRPQLLEIVGRPSPSAIAEAAVEVLGVFIAALRRSEAAGDFTPKTTAELRQVCHDLMLAYLGPELSPRVIYPGTDGMAAQGFYRLVHDPDAPESLVKAFFDLDVKTRPPQKRSLLTAHARDAEYAAYLGDLDRARSEGRSFVSALELVGMLRHLATIKEQGYFAY